MIDLEKVKLDELCEITSSKRIFAKDYVTEGVPFYRGKEITEKYKGALNVTTELFITEEKYLEIKAKHGVPVSGDMLLTSVGTLGSTYVVSSNDQFYFKDGNLTWFRNFRGLDSRYLKYWLETPEGKGELSRATIGTSQSALTIANLKQIEIRLPPIDQQVQIADKLDTFEQLIENNTRRIAILEEMAQAIYREWFVEFKYPESNFIEGQVESDTQLPSGWSRGAFTDVAEVLSGGTPKTTVSEFWNGDIHFFTPKDAGSQFYCLSTEKSISESGLSKCASKLYPRNTVFITARGTVGKVSLPDHPMAMNQSCYALQTKQKDAQRYLYLLTRSQVAYLKQNTGGATFDTIIKDTFERMQVVIPPSDLVLQFEQLITPFFEEMSLLARSVENLKKQRDLLLPKLISGQIELS